MFPCAQMGQSLRVGNSGCNIVQHKWQPNRTMGRINPKPTRPRAAHCGEAGIIRSAADEAPLFEMWATESDQRRATEATDKLCAHPPLRLANPHDKYGCAAARSAPCSVGSVAVVSPVAQRATRSLQHYSLQRS